MTSSNFNKKIKGILEDLIAPLGSFLKKNLQSTHPNWWEDVVLKSLTMDQYKNAKARKIMNIAGLDLAALLKVFVCNHYSIFQREEILPEFRNIIKEMGSIRNRWSHAGGSSYPADDIYRDLDTIKRFAKEIEAKKSLLDEVEQLMAEIRNTISEPTHTNDHVAEEKELTLHPDIKWGQKKYDNSNCEYENVSVAAGKTIKLIEQYKIHSCPDTYKYKKTKNIHFRAKESRNEEAFPIRKILKIPMNARGDLGDLENHGLTKGEVQRLISYMSKNPFPGNNRYYILEASIYVSNPPIPGGPPKTLYF